VQSSALRADHDTHCEGGIDSLTFLYIEEQKVQKVRKTEMTTTKSPIINSEVLLKKKLGPIRWLWDGIIAHRTITAIAGDAGAYKTWFTLYLAQAIANGESFLDRPTSRNKVIIFDKENSEPMLQKRLRSCGASRYFDIYLKSRQPESPMLVDEKGVVSPLYMDYAGRGYLMIFDSLTRFHRFSENSASKMRLVLEGFQKLQDAGATVIFTHHTGKGKKNDYRGSSEIKAGVDALFTMRSTED